MSISTSITCILFWLWLASATVEAQQLFVDHWLVEPSITYTLLENDEVLVAGIRAGRQLSDAFFLGGTASLLLGRAETITATGYDRVRNLLYAGPTVEYSDTFRGRVRYYLGATIGIGAAGYESATNGIVSDRSGLFAGIEPEIGLLVRVGRRRRWQFRTALGFLAGKIIGGDVTLYTLPAATLGVRFGL